MPTATVNPATIEVTLTDLHDRRAFQVDFMGTDLGQIAQIQHLTEGWSEWVTTQDDETFETSAEAVQYLVQRAILRGGLR